MLSKNKKRLTILIIILTIIIPIDIKLFADDKDEKIIMHYPEIIKDTANSPFLKADNIYVNNQYGFAFDTNGFYTDDKYEDIKTTFYTGYTYVDIFYDNFNGSNISLHDYLYYSNKNFRNSEYIHIEQDETFKLNGQLIRIIKWQRKPLKYGKDNNRDLIYYASIDISKNYQELYTIQINSHAKINVMDYINRFRLIPIDNKASIKKASAKRIDNSKWSEETKNFYNNDFKQNKKTTLGIFEPSSKNDINTISRLEKKNNLTFPYILEYYSMQSKYNQKRIDKLYEENRILEFTYQTSNGAKLCPDMLYEILDGKHEAKIKELAKVLSEIKGPVLFRLNNEMNGDWCSYNALHYNRDTRLYIKLWEYIYHEIQQAGGNNVIFVFNPNEKSFPNFKWNHYMNYFPSEEYVDVIGVTGYNTGNYYDGETWRDFETIYDAFMPDYKSRFIDYDFYITEFGSSTIGGDRNKWLNDMFKVINKYDFKVAIYWNGTDWDVNKNPARIYRVDNDKHAMKIFENYFNNQ